MEKNLAPTWKRLFLSRASSLFLLFSSPFSYLFRFHSSFSYAFKGRDSRPNRDPAERRHVWILTTSSRIEIELAARIPIGVFGSVSVFIASLTILRIFLGVMLLSTTCCKVARAFWTFSSFSIRFFSRFSAAVDILVKTSPRRTDIRLYRP